MADETFTKADLDAAVAEAIDKAVEGLKTKNDELIGDNKKLKADLRKTQDIKPEDVAAIEAERDKAIAELAAAQKQAKDATTAAEKATKALETESAFTQKLLISDGLKSALIANGVKDEDYIDMAVAKFSAGASVKIEGETRTAMIGDKPMADAIKEWAGTDAGKKVVAAAINGGGGAPGGDGKGGNGKSVTQEALDGMRPKERAAHFASGGSVVDA